MSPISDEDRESIMDIFNHLEEEAKKKGITNILAKYLLLIPEA